MQKILIILLGSIFFVTCKKQNSSYAPKNDFLFDDTTAHFKGLKPATAEELKTIPTLESYDTSKISILPGTSGTHKIQTASYEIPNFPEAGNQNTYRYNSCMGWALGYAAMGYSYRALLKDYSIDLAANFVWNFVNGGQNTGDKSFVSAMKVTKEKGNCLHSLMPDNYPYNKLPDETLEDNALDYTISDVVRFESINLGLMKAMLQKNKPLVIAINTYPEFDKATATFWKKTSDGNFVWLSHSNVIDGQHALVVTGYNDNDDFKAFKVQNSWGKKYGKDGIIWISYDLFKDVILNTSEGPEIYMIIPRIATTKTATISSNNATLNGEIYNTGFFSPTQRGFCIGENTRPTIANKVVSENKGSGSFSLQIKDLRGATKYYFRAFASDGSRTLYGNQEVFTTDAPTAPTITTTVPADITFSSISLGGIITSDGGADILDKGITYSPNSNLAPSNTISAGTGNNTFQKIITGLSANTTYYVRAYAINNIGTSYGNEVSFTTSAKPVKHFQGSYVLQGSSYHLIFDLNLIDGIGTMDIPEGHYSGTLNLAGTDLTFKSTFDYTNIYSSVKEKNRTYEFVGKYDGSTYSGNFKLTVVYMPSENSPPYSTRGAFFVQ